MDNHPVYKTAGKLVEVAWPVGADGKRLPASELASFNYQRRISMTCNCGLLDSSLSILSPCRIGTSKVTEEVVAVCNKTPSRCGMFVNLTTVSQLATRTSSYPHLLTDGSPPPIQMLLEAFKNMAHQEFVVAPYFPGYLGEFTGPDQPTGCQLYRDFRFSREIYLMTRPRFQPDDMLARHLKRIARPRCAGIDLLKLFPQPPPLPAHKQLEMIGYLAKKPKVSSRASLINKAEYPKLPVAPVGESNTGDTDTMSLALVQRLAKGHGILEEEWRNLTSPCEYCGQRYIRVWVAKHMATCRGVVYGYAC
ncbi:hypothetical protein CVT26_006448 [Gymnopilus dilepis]|uniref:Uncharacterized protein n=1 Tax=Gymnopilus dilepis TaxID=231916 RepID=A0A409Y1W6_9AGAR|nr:hypothetical protein CVT26_006448 [Gymnopilus dilepis]